MLKSKKIVISEFSVDVFVLDGIPAISKRLEILRPLRTRSDGKIYVLYKENLYKLYLDSVDNFAIVLSDKTYVARGASRITKLPISLEVDYAEPPLNYLSSDGFRYEIERNQFGVYIHISAADELVEQLVGALIEKNNFNILSWGEDVSPDTIGQVSWTIKLSPGLSVDTVRSALTQILDDETRAHREAKLIPQLGSASVKENSTISKLPTDVITNASEQVQVTSDNDANNLDFLFEEIEQLTRQVSSLSAENSELRSASQKNELVVANRRGTAERVIANALYACFPKLAFAPEVVSELKERFNRSSAIWDIFLKLNNGEDLPLEKIKGLPGTAGWFELRKHISTGDDNRGRLYCRRSSKGHTFDIVLHWKKDEKEQQKTFKKLVNYAPFESTKTVFM